MKNKIVYRLVIYFSTTLILFSLIIGGIFITLFKAHTIEVQKSELEAKAITIAMTLSELINENQNGRGKMGMMNSGGQGGYMAYLRFLDDIAGADVWIVDENLQLITLTHMNTESFNYNDLPKDADDVVKDVFKGKTTFSEGFSDLLKSPTLTIGTPIISGENVIGALLLHSPVNGIDNAVKQGFQILIISVLIAFALAVLLSVFLSVYFTKPLKKMRNSTLQLADGDYSIKTGIKSQDEIGELAKAIDILSEKLLLSSLESEKLEMLRRDFVANVSHELRTPVTVIRGSLEALYDKVVTDPKQVDEYYKQMLNESIFLQRLVEDLLDLSKLQNTDFKIEMNEINLCDLLDDVVRSSKNNALNKKIEINYINDFNQCKVTGDYGRLRQMLMIIIDNAIKFSEDSSVVTISKNENSIVVHDNGIGINEEDLPHIFERFYKSKSEINKNGTGLGLPIAKQIAERHGIQISVESNPSKGTDFLLKF